MKDSDLVFNVIGGSYWLALALSLIRGWTDPRSGFWEHFQAYSLYVTAFVMVTTLAFWISALLKRSARSRG